MPKSSSSRRIRGRTRRGGNTSSVGRAAARGGKPQRRHPSSVSLAGKSVRLIFRLRDSVGRRWSAEMWFDAGGGGLMNCRLLPGTPYEMLSDIASEYTGGRLEMDRNSWRLVPMRSGR